MARTFIRQESQIRRSDVYDDSITPSLATYETNPVNIEDDLNNIRSQIQNIMNRNGASFPAGNWYSDMTAPTSFENGVKRGVDTLNQELHDLERKRVLVTADKFLVDVTVPAAVAATGTLTATGNFANNDTVTTGTKTYTFQTVLTNVDGNVLIGASASDSLDNLIAAINLGAGAGTLYATATTANGFVSAAAGAGDTLVATALLTGTIGNTYATSDTSANASWGAGTLTGGTGDLVILSTTQLPSNTTAAVGAVATRGTVVAYDSTFGTWSLDLVSGSSAISPKNLCDIIDSVTHDPILSSGRRIYALLGFESNTDGATITDTTPNRVELEFVRLNSAGNALERVPAVDIAGKVVHYAAVERKALEDLTEQDFLRGAVTDVAASTTVTRQIGYDNQGTTPVEQTTNAILDLNAAGIYWDIRDLANASLFRVTEGSTGGTSTVGVTSDVDTFDVNALVNDFDQGLRVDTGGQRINIGETAGLIESTSANDLRILGAAELYLDDGNQTGSTWSQVAGIKLSDTTAEWDAFEVKFGEVSLLNAITSSKRKDKVYANITANTSANTDVGGVAGGVNLDVQLPDMSTGDFLVDYDVFLNGELQRPGADASANNDYYPGTSLANGQLRFEFATKNNDVICVIPYV